jgi:hypothetical protein
MNFHQGHRRYPIKSYNFSPAPPPLANYSYIKYVVILLVMMLIVVLLTNDPNKLLWGTRPVIYQYLSDIQPDDNTFEHLNHNNHKEKYTTYNQPQEKSNWQVQPASQRYLQWNRDGKLYVKTNKISKEAHQKTKGHCVETLRILLRNVSKAIE